MRIPRIHCEGPLHEGASVTLGETASRHIAKVLRMEAGRPLIIFDGQGGEYQASITSVSKKHVNVLLEEFKDLDRSSPLSIHLGIGLSKGDRFEWVLQKATELGVSQITPLFTGRSEVKLSGDRLEKKLGHWRQIAISACEQCQLNRVPDIVNPLRFDQWLPTLDQDHKFVLHHRSDSGLHQLAEPKSVALAIGPEGGLSDSEIQAALDSGFKALTLGPRVMRTETAPLAAISICQYLWGDLSG